MTKWKKIGTLTATMLLSMSLILAGCASTSGSGGQTKEETQNAGGAVEPTELKYATYISSSHYMGVIDEAMFQRIEEQTSGQVKASLFFDGILVQPKDWYQELIRGSADITQAQVGTEKERFQLAYATALFNYGITDLKTLLDFTKQLESEMPELAAEYNDVVPLSRLTAGQSWIHTVKKPIRTLEDFKGLNLKVADDASQALAQALGANALKIPISETYSALEKGVIDGVITGADPLKTFKFAEVTKYSTALPYATPWIHSKIMNKESFEKLSPEAQNVLKENGVWWEEQLITELEKESEAGLKLAKEQGNEIIELSEQEKDKMLAIMEENAKAVAAELDAKGLKGTELFEQARAVADQMVK